jgi:hypothetical protein
MQASHLCLVDNSLNALDQEVVRHQFDNEPPRGKIALLAALSPISTYAAHELLRTWRRCFRYVQDRRVCPTSYAWRNPRRSHSVVLAVSMPTVVKKLFAPCPSRLSAISRVAESCAAPS